MNEQEIAALQIVAASDQLHAMIEVLARAVAAAEVYLDAPAVVSGPNSKVKAMTRAYVEEAMALIRKPAP